MAMKTLIAIAMILSGCSASSDRYLIPDNSVSVGLPDAGSTVCVPLLDLASCPVGTTSARSCRGAGANGIPNAPSKACVIQIKTLSSHGSETAATFCCK